MSKENQTTKLLTTLLLGGGVGVALTLFFALFFGPSGQYLAKNVLLSPRTIEEIRESSIAAGSERYHFAGMTLYQYDPKTDKTESRQLSPTHYALFFDKIQSDRSLSEMSQEIESHFYDPQMTRLVFMIKGGRTKNLSIFQEVQVPRSGNYYRIQLHEAGPGREWVYFEHEGIFRILDGVLQK